MTTQQNLFGDKSSCARCRGEGVVSVDAHSIGLCPACRRDELPPPANLLETLRLATQLREAGGRCTTLEVADVEAAIDEIERLGQRVAELEQLLEQLRYDNLTLIRKREEVVERMEGVLRERGKLEVSLERLRGILSHICEPDQRMAEKLWDRERQRQVTEP